LPLSNTFLLKPLWLSQLIYAHSIELLVPAVTNLFNSTDLSDGFEAAHVYPFSF